MISFISTSNFPNPFRNSTKISFSAQNPVNNPSIKIYNLKGQLIKVLKTSIIQNNPNKGYVVWYGDDKYNQKVSNGIYFYKLNINGKTKAVKKCILLRWKFKV